MAHWQNYILAKSMQDALDALAAAPGPARLVAGGTDLLLDLQQGRHPSVHTLVDVTRIPELTALELRADRIFIGAAVPLNRIVAHPAVQRHLPALHQACGLIGGPQVRNTATLGGNVAHALPAADGTISLLALDAQAEVVGPQGCRLVQMEALFSGPGRSALDPTCELLVGFHLPLRGDAQGSAFRRVMRPQGVAIAILNLSAWVQRAGDVIGDVRIGVGPAGPVPFRARQAEDVLRSCVPDEEALARAQEALLAASRFRTSPHRATQEYRRDVAGMLLRESLLAAWESSMM